PVAELRTLPRDGRNRHRDDRDGGDQRELGQVLRGQHLGRVAGGDVPHLVPDDRGELVLGVAQLDERRVDVDRAAGEREGVHLGRTAARTSVRIVLGWTATLAPAASTSSRRPPPSWPVRLSPFTSTAVAFSPPSANSTRSTCFVSRSVGRLPTFSRRGPKAPDTR